MADNLFEIEQRLTLTKSGGSAETELKKVRDQIKGVSDETKAYNEWLAKNAKELGEVSKAQAAAADESERYQQVLEKMRVAQVMETQEAEKSVKWTQSKKEGSADLSKTLSALQGNLVEATAAGKKENEVTAEAFTSKKQLKDMVKQLGQEFPVLGTLGRLALNPIAFSTSAITAAFVIWKYRVDELKTSLGGVEMPDFKEGDVERIKRVAEAYKTLAEKLLATGTNAATVTKQLELANKVIEANEGLRKALGIETGTSADEAKARELRGAAAALGVSGAAKIAASGSFNPNNAAAANLEKAAVAATAEKAKIEQRLTDIQSLREMDSADPRRLFYDNRFRARYGYGTSYDDAEGMERDKLNTQEAVIGRFAGRQNKGAMATALRADGEKDLAGRDDLLQKLYDVLVKIANTQAGAGMEGVMRNPMDSGSLAEMAQQTGRLATGVALLAQSNANLRAANETMARIIATTNRKP